MIKKPKFNNGWSFAIVNGRLAKIHFDKKYEIWAHCYVKRNEYSKSEQRMIDSDIKKYQFAYRKSYYIDKIRGLKHKVPSIYKIFPDLKNYGKKPKRVH